MTTTVAPPRAPRTPRAEPGSRTTAVLGAVATAGLALTAVLVAAASWWAVVALAAAVAAGVAADRVRRT